MEGVLYHFFNSTRYTDGDFSVYGLAFYIYLEIAGTWLGGWDICFDTIVCFCAGGLSLAFLSWWL
jgi:hypothetical protein